jgi:hypothetical protein
MERTIADLFAPRLMLEEWMFKKQNEKPFRQKKSEWLFSLNAFFHSTVFAFSEKYTM